MKPLQELYTEITADDGLKKAFAEAARDNRIAEFAHENGADVTLDEIRAFLADKSAADRELTSDELENAAGGVCLIPNPDAVTSMVNTGICSNTI